MRRFLLALLLVTIALPCFAQEFVLGLIPEQNVFKQVERYKPLAKYLSSKMGVEVKISMLSRYGNILESFSSGRMDGAFWGSFTGALAVEKLGIEPIARPLYQDGSSNYRGIIFVKKDSPIDSIEKLKGKSFAFVDRATTAGFLFPLAVLKSRGVAAYDKYFSTHFFTGSHDAAILSVINGEADGGAAKDTIYKMMLKEKPELASKIKVLAESDPVPSNTLGVRKDLSPELATKLKTALLEMDKDPDGLATLKEFGAVRFIPTSREDYKPVFEMASKAGVNLKEYDYVNK